MLAGLSMTNERPAAIFTSAGFEQLPLARRAPLELGTLRLGGRLPGWRSRVLGDRGLMSVCLGKGDFGGFRPPLPPERVGVRGAAQRAATIGADREGRWCCPAPHIWRRSGGQRGGRSRRKSGRGGSGQVVGHRAEHHGGQEREGADEDHGAQQHPGEGQVVGPERAGGLRHPLLGRQGTRRRPAGRSGRGTAPAAGRRRWRCSRAGCCRPAPRTPTRCWPRPRRTRRGSRRTRAGRGWRRTPSTPSPRRRPPRQKITRGVDQERQHGELDLLRLHLLAQVLGRPPTPSGRR